MTRNDRVVSIIEWFAGIVSVVYGIGYGISIATDQVPSSVFGEVLTHPAIGVLYVVGFILSGILIIAGKVFRLNFMASQGFFLNAICRIFQMISIWQVSGFFQPSWLTTALVFVLYTTLWIARQIPEGYHRGT